MKGGTHIFRDLFDQRAGLLQTFGGEIKFKPEQVLIWALILRAPEQPAVIGVVDVALFRNLFQRAQPETMLFNVLLALLVSGKSERLGTSQRSACAHNSQCQAFQQFCTQPRTFAAHLQPA